MIHLKNVSKTYKNGVHALRNIDLQNRRWKSLFMSLVLREVENLP